MTRNKTLTVTLAPVLAVMLLAGAAQAKGWGEGRMGGPGGPSAMMPDFATLDTDGDGRITREELEARRLDRQGAIDPDGDGFVSLEEMKAHAVAQATARAEAMVDRMFAMMDTDKDGRLSAAEVLTGPRGGLDRMFDRVDRDGDGAISKEEYDRMAAHMKKRGEGRHGGERRGPPMRGHMKGGHGMPGGQGAPEAPAAPEPAAPQE